VAVVRLSNQTTKNVPGLHPLEVPDVVRRIPPVLEEIYFLVDFNRIGGVLLLTLLGLGVLLRLTCCCNRAKNAYLPLVSSQTVRESMSTLTIIALIFFLLALVLGICIGLLLAWIWWRRHHATPPPPPPPCPPYTIPDQLGETELTTQISVRLMGTTANGVPLPAVAAGTPPPAKVIWVDHGNEVLVHLDSTAVRILDRTVLVSVDLETDQTGRTPLVCSFAISGSGELGGLIATTDEFPRGLGSIASCWGQQLQSAVWSTLMGVVNDHAAERSLTPRALSASAGVFSLNAGAPLTNSTGGTV
jgi:hypothetical protein